jgi:CHAT domain-containing protein
MKASHNIKKTFIIGLILLFLGNVSTAQTWEQMEIEYNSLLKNKKNDLALIKAKEMYNWVKTNESDTSLHLPISLKLVGNSFNISINDSALFFYDKALNVLSKQNRSRDIQASKIYFNKANCYYRLNNKSQSLNEAKKSIEILDFMEFPDYPFCVWPLEIAAKITYEKGEFGLAKKYFEKKANLIFKYAGKNNQDYISSIYALANCLWSSKNYDTAKVVYEEVLKNQKQFLNKNDFEYSKNLCFVAYKYKQANFYTDARKLFMEGLQIQKNYIENNFRDYLSNLLNLAYLYRDIEDFKLEEPLLKEAFELGKIKLGEYDINFSKILFAMGCYYRDIGNKKEAEVNLIKSFTIRKKNSELFSADYTESLISLGILYKEDFVDYFKAEKYLIEAIDILKGNVLYFQDQKYLQCLENLSEIYIELGKYNDAENLYKNIISIRKSLNNYNFLDYSYDLIALSKLYLLQGKTANADLLIKESLEINKKLGSTYYCDALFQIAISYQYNDYYEKAVLLYSEALAIVNEVSGVNSIKSCSAINNLGMIYEKMGNFVDAKKMYLQVIDISKAGIKIDDNFIIKTLHNLFNLYKNEGDFIEAEKVLKLMESLCLKIYGNEDVNYAMIMFDWASLYLKIGNSTQSIKYVTYAMDIYKSKYGMENSEYFSCINVLAINYKNLGQRASAEPLYLDALEFYRKNNQENNFNYSASIQNIANYYYDIGNYKDAEKYFRELLNIKINYLERNFVWLSEKQKELFWEKESKLFHFINSFAMQSKNVILNSSELPFNSSLFAKSILLQMSTGIKESIIKTRDTSLKNIYSELTIRRLLLSKLNSEGSDKLNLIKTTELQADSLDQLLSKKMSSYTNYKNNFSLTWKDVQMNLNNDEAALEFERYYDDSDSSYSYMALIIKQGDKYPQLIKLCSEDELKQYSPETELKEIYDLVWKPLLPSLTNIKTIYYSPSGLLNNIPFQALYKEVNGQREYVMDKYSIHQLTSTRYLALDLKKKEQEPIQTSIALFGGINYNDYPNALADTTNYNQSTEAAFLYKNAIVLNRELDSTRTGASYLPGTKKEVETIANVLNAKRWQVDVSEGKNATENKIKSFSGSNSKAILHIATHGFAFPDKEEKRKDMAFNMMSGNDKYNASDNPMIRCGLLFGGSNLTWQGKGDSLLNITNEDGVLTAYELSQLDLTNTKLAVLSACETGKGAIQGSEGTFGLKRALKLAGVDNMIVSLWEVPDDATMELMTIFYTELANTKKPVSSFETAQKAMRLNYPNEPKKWAGFVFVR